MYMYMYMYTTYIIQNLMYCGLTCYMFYMNTIVFLPFLPHSLPPSLFPSLTPSLSHSLPPSLLPSLSSHPASPYPTNPPPPPPPLPFSLAPNHSHSVQILHISRRPTHLESICGSQTSSVAPPARDPPITWTPACTSWPDLNVTSVSDVQDSNGLPRDIQTSCHTHTSTFVHVHVQVYVGSC